MTDQLTEVERAQALAKSQLELKVERLEQHLADALKQFELMAEELVEMNKELFKVTHRLDGLRPDRRNCRSCGKVVKSASGRCEVCGAGQ